MSPVPPNHGRHEMARAVRLRSTRRERRSREGERPLWRTLSVAGSLGWLVVLPALAGVFVGRWLDAIAATGVTFTAASIALGVVAGGFLAWRRMHEP